MAGPPFLVILSCAMTWSQTKHLLTILDEERVGHDGVRESSQVRMTTDLFAKLLSNCRPCRWRKTASLPTHGSA